MNLNQLQKAGAIHLQNGLRMMLCDPVGSGKTRTALLWADGFRGSIIILAPNLAGVITWPTEIVKWKDDLKIQGEFEVITKGIDLPYSLTKRFTIVSLDLFFQNWHITEKWFPSAFIVDESHNIPLVGSLGYRLARKLLATGRNKSLPLLLITSSPARNSLIELWRFYHLLQPLKFTSFQDWLKLRFGFNLERHRGITVDKPNKTPKNLVAFKKEMETYIVKRDIPKSYPYPIFDFVKLPLTKAQKNLFKNFKQDGYLLKDDGTYLLNPIVLTELERLKTIGITPHALNISGDSNKVKWLFEFIDSTDEPIVIGSTSTKALEFIASLRPNQIKCLTGSTSTANRIKLTDEFKSGEFQVIALNYGIAESLTLTNSRLMVALDFPWVPETFIQWIGRCARESQTKQVVVYTLNNNEIDNHMAETMYTKDILISSALERRHL